MRELATRWPRPDRVLRAALTGMLGVVLVSGIARAALGVDLLEQLGWAPGCPFRAVTGIPCPGCGMTHALLLLGQLRLGEAIAANPMSPLLVAVAAIGAARPSLVSRLGRTVVAGPALAVVLAAWSVRILGG